MKKLLLFLAFVGGVNLGYIWAQNQNPYDFYFDFPASGGQRLYYKIVDGEAQVIYPSTSTSNRWYGYTQPRGSLEIPATVSDGNGTSYSVTSIAEYAFSNCTSLASVTIPSSVTSIHERSFYGCSGLTSISVAQGNTTFDSRNNCNAIIKTSNNMLVVGCRNTNIPSTVTSIGDYAFHRRSGLSNVTIPSSVTSIGRYAFNGCVDIVSINLPNSVRTISDFAFDDCSGLTSVTIPSSVTSIGSGIFIGCTSLASISVAQGNTTYDSRNNCNAIIKTSTNTLVQGCNSTTIPYGVTSIGSNAFKDHTGLTSISIPVSVTSIDYDAFNGCIGLTSVSLPNSVISINSRAFSGCSGLTSVSIPNTITSIKLATFSGCSGLTSMTIPNSVTSIGESAFNGCSSLTSMTIPNSVTSIGQNAFKECIGLESITVEAQTVPATAANAFSGVSTDIPVNVPCGMVSTYRAANGWSQFDTYIQENPNSPHYSLYYTLDNTNNTATVYGSAANGRVAVDNCGTRGNLNIPESVTYQGNDYTVTSIGESAFYENRDLVSVEIPESVTSIGAYAFNRCSSLASATIPNTVTTIGEGVFYYCENLASVTIGNRVTSISPSAFERCGLTSITIPNNVTSIGRGAFRDCSSLQSVNIHEHVTSIGDFVFIGCTDLASISVDANNQHYDSRNNCNAIIETSTNTLMSGCKNTVIPESVTVIGDNAFRGCTGLTSITIPNSVTTIEVQAFRECSGLERVTFDNSPTAIGSETFNGCSRLSSLSLGNSVTTIGSNAFQGCSSLETLTIPSSVNSILGSPFKDCISLAEIIVEAGNNTYDSRNGCNAIIETSSNTLVQGCNNTAIPNSVTAIAEAAFYGCSGLTSVTIPNSVTTINPYTFYGCSGLTSVTISNLVTTIGLNAFYGCSGLTSVTIPNLVTTIGPNAFYGCSGLESVTIPRSVTAIDLYAFSGCSGLTSVTIPESVTFIAEFAFNGCSGLKSVVKLSSTNNIHRRAFDGCDNLKTIYLYNGQSRYQDPNGYSFYGCTAKRLVQFTTSGSGLNTLYVIEDTRVRVIDRPESSCQSNQIPKADLLDNFICLAEDNSGWKAKNIVLTDCEDEFQVSADFTADTVEFDRSFYTDRPSTVCLPFETTAEQRTNFKLYDFSSYNNSGTAGFTLLESGNSTANRPYIIEYGSAKDYFQMPTLTNVQFRATPNPMDTVNRNDFVFVGTFQKVDMTGENRHYYGLYYGHFVESGANRGNTAATVNPFRSYFYMDNSTSVARPTGVDLQNEGEVSIELVDPEMSIQYSNDVYDLMGRCVRKNADSLRGLPRGIYIWRGKKLLNY